MSTYEDLLTRVTETHDLGLSIARGVRGWTAKVVSEGGDDTAGWSSTVSGSPDREAACKGLYEHLRDDLWIRRRMPGCDVCMGARVVPSDEFRDGGTAGCGDCCGGAVPDFHPSDVAVREAAARSLK